jgi:DNA polymerase (family X)
LRSRAEELAGLISGLLTAEFGEALEDVVEAGELRTGAEEPEGVSLVLVSATPAETLGAARQELFEHGWEQARDAECAVTGEAFSFCRLEAPSGHCVELWACDRASLPETVVAATGPPAHASEVLEHAPVHDVGESEPPDRAAYERRGLVWVEPELRASPDPFGEAERIGADILVEDAFVAELHCHSEWSDGRATILEMAQAAMERGDRYMAITDHSAPLAMVNGLDEVRLLEQRLEINQVNAELGPDFVVLHGSEVEVLSDGTLGLSDEVLARLDWVVASVHVSQRQEPKVLKERIAKVLANPLVDCIGHPTGRLIGRRPPAAVDAAWLAEAAAASGTVLEINASPNRLDLSADHARLALQAGARLTINSDAHRTRTLGIRRHGVAVARRAGARVQDVVNCLDREALEGVRPRNRA